MLHRPDWMAAPSDEDILYIINEQGNFSPEAIAEHTDHTRQYISQRCRLLVEKGFLRQLGRGLYGITDLGQAWIEREITLEDLEARGLD